MVGVGDGRETERGASMVEFALLLPVFMMLVLGMFSGGLAYNQKQELTSAAREGGRYGATLPDDESFPAPATWATTVRDLTVDRSNGDLTTDQVCVALVTGAGFGTVLNSDTTNYLWRGPNSGSSGAGTQGCYDDGGSVTETRVQVRVRRSAKLEVLVFSRNLNLVSEATSKHETDNF